MPGLYGITSNANISVSNTTGLYITSGNVQFTGNIPTSNTTGLYIGQGQVPILNNAQLLLQILSNNSTVGFSLTNANSQVQGTVLASGVTAGTYGDATDIPRITVGSDGRVTSITNVAVTIPATYGNANVAAYLPTYTGSLDNSSSIINLYANAAVQAGQIQTISANLGSFETYANATYATQTNLSNYEIYANAAIASTNANVAAANIAISNLQSNAAVQEGEITSLRANVTAANAAIQTISANLGSFETYANVTYSTIANAASQQAQIDSTNANVTAANAAIQTISANLGSFETYANVTFVTTANANTYSNTNVAAYLSGNITTGNITNTGVITSTGNITAPYHIGTAQYFSGNLAGNVLYDGLKNSANIQAAAFGNINPINSSPLSQYQQSGQGGVGTAAPGSISPAPAVYTYFSGNGVTAITTAGIASMISQANVTVRTSAAIQTIVGQSFQTSGYGLGAGNMSTNDRIKGQIAAMELWPQGATWGSNQFRPQTGTDFTPYTSTSVATAVQTQMSLSGSGNVSAASAQSILSYVSPTVGAMNVNYVTGYAASVGYASLANVSGIGISTINVARGLLVTGNYGNTATPTNQVINNLYGVHIPTNWEFNGTPGRTIIYLKRSLQSEDVNTDLYNAGNVIIGGNLITTSTTAPITFNSPTTYNSNVTVAGSNSLLKVTTFTVTALNAITGSTGQFAAVSNGTGKSGGQMAYWDTTNSRWSWFDTNLAVS